MIVAMAGAIGLSGVDVFDSVYDEAELLPSESTPHFNVPGLKVVMLLTGGAIGWVGIFPGSKPAIPGAGGWEPGVAVKPALGSPQSHPFRC